MFGFRDRIKPLQIVIIVLIIGAFIMCWGIISYMMGSRTANRCSSSTLGVVVNSEKHSTIRRKVRHISYVATVEPNDGSIFNNSALFSDESDYSYTKGESVMIHYDPSDPSTYYIQHAEPTAGDLTQVVIGAVLIFLGLGFFAMYKKIK